MPPAIVGPLDNNMAMDTSLPVKTPLTISLGELPAPPVTSLSPVSQSSTPPLPVPPPTHLAPPRAMELSTSPSQRLLALADATVNATTFPLPFDDRSPNPPLSSIPATPNPSPSRPLTPVVLRRTRSPLPSFFLNHTPSPPLEYQETPLMIFGVGTPSQEDVKDVRKNCRALLKAMEVHQRLESALEAWTEGLMPAINILGNDGLNDEVFTTSFRDFTAVQHLFFVPQILTEVEPFLDNDSVQSDPPESLGARYNPTISKSSSPSPITINPPLSDELNNPTYPGDGWALFDAGNPGHYPLTFVNDKSQPEVAKYICFRSTEEDTYLVGTMGKNEKEYATPLQAKAYPSPNFNRRGVKDTDLNLFHPAHLSRLMVDTALVNLKDPGILADVHRLRGLHNIISNAKRQHLELKKKETRAEADLLIVERRLASSAVRTRLQQHLLATRPPSPPTFLLPTRDYRVPRIFAAQGPPDIEEGEDNYEDRAVLGKRRRGTQVKFPYCLKCNHDTSGHVVEDCPLWKTCRWCLSTQHAHDECPSPHNSCAANRCLVYFGHPNFGSYCSATPAGLLRHELEVAYAEAEWDNADTCYEGSDK